MRNDDKRPSGAVDQEAFEKVIRDNLSPEGAAAIVRLLRRALESEDPTDPAVAQARWLADTLAAMLATVVDYEVGD